MNVPAPRQRMPFQEFRQPYEAEAISAELAKMLGLVAPSSMTVDQQTLWLASAVDALEGIRADEIRHVSAQVRRTVKRHNDIVPEIAKLVAERRARPPVKDRSGIQEHDIRAEAQKRRSHAKTREEIQAAADWERQALVENGYYVRPLAGPLSRYELDTLAERTRSFGLAKGFLKYDNGLLVEAII